MRRFGSDNMRSIMERLGMDEDQPIESKMITRAVEQAQKRVEGNNFDARKQILQYDDVMREQREIIYNQRMEVLESDNLRAIVEGMIKSVIERTVRLHTPENEVPEEWDFASLISSVRSTMLNEQDLTEKEIKGLDPEEMIELIYEKVIQSYNEKEAQFTPENMREFEKVIMLRTVDRKWMNHIDQMDQLRQGIHLRAYGQNDPLREYKFEGFEMFEQMIESIEEEVTMYIMKAQVEQNLERKEVAEGKAAVHASSSEKQPKKRQPVRVEKAPGRNAPCPCGSGKKYKQCCGKLD